MYMDPSWFDYSSTTAASTVGFARLDLGNRPPFSVRSVRGFRSCRTWKEVRRGLCTEIGGRRNVRYPQIFFAGDRLRGTALRHGRRRRGKASAQGWRGDALVAPPCLRGGVVRASEKRLLLAPGKGGRGRGEDACFRVARRSCDPCSPDRRSDRWPDVRRPGREPGASVIHYITEEEFPAHDTDAQDSIGQLSLPR
jgi:hypothetical protein